MGTIKSLENFKHRVRVLYDFADKINLPYPHTHEKLLADIKYELRVIAVKLRLYREEDFHLIKEWVIEEASEARLNRINDTLTILQEIQDRPISDDDEDHKARKQQIRRSIYQLRTGKKYSEDFTHYLDLEDFFHRQRLYANELRKVYRAFIATGHGAPILGNFGRFLRSAFPAFLEASANLGKFALAIPFLQAIFMVVPAAINLIRNFMYRTPMRERVLSILIACIGIGALITAVILPFTVLGFGAAMVTIGVIVDHYKPYFELRKEIAAVEFEINIINNRVLELENPDIPCILSDRERTELLNVAIKYYTRCWDSGVDLDALRTLIRVGAVADIENNAELRDVFQLDATHDLRRYLLEHQTRSIDQKYDDLQRLRQEKNDKVKDMINGVFIFIGAVMIAIPFPPVQIAGAALMLITSIVSISLFYNLHGKLWNAFKNYGKPQEPINAKRSEWIEMTEVRELTNNAKLHKQVASVQSESNRLNEEYITDEDPKPDVTVTPPPSPLRENEIFDRMELDL